MDGAARANNDLHSATGETTMNAPAPSKIALAYDSEWKQPVTAATPAGMTACGRRRCACTDRVPERATGSGPEALNKSFGDALRADQFGVVALVEFNDAVARAGLGGDNLLGLLAKQRARLAVPAVGEPVAP